MPTENAIVETSLIQEKKHKKNKDKKKEKKRRHESDAESNSKKQKSDKGSKPSKKGSKSSVWTYEQHPDLTQLNASIVDEFMKKNAIQTQALGDSGVDLRPIMEFSQVTFPEMLQSSLSSFKNPTPIQAISWPFLLKGKDVIGIAATGSGKT
jgi:ATP-dependent RNA helicase DBP3